MSGYFVNNGYFCKYLHKLFPNGSAFAGQKTDTYYATASIVSKGTATEAATTVKEISAARAFTNTSLIF